MKNYMILTAMLFSMAFMQPAQSQVSVNINIGVQPLWGPVGYDYVEYYYLPDYEVYYYVPDARFVYFDAGEWIFVPVLPVRFGTINYYSTYKVVVNQPKAYLSFNTHKVKYVGYKGKGAKQVVIRNSNDAKYFVVKGHPKYGQAKKASPAPASGKVKASPQSGSSKMKSAPASGKTKAAPQSGSPKMKSAPAPRGSHDGGNKGGGHGGGNKGGGKQK